jgi:hypothetical protein
MTTDVRFESGLGFEAAVQRLFDIAKVGGEEDGAIDGPFALVRVPLNCDSYLVLPEKHVLVPEERRQLRDKINAALTLLYGVDSHAV